MNNNENKKDRGFSQGITLIIIGVCVMPINKWIRTVIVLALLACGFILYQQKADSTSFKERIEIRTRSHPRIIFDDDDFDDDFDDD